MDKQKFINSLSAGVLGGLIAGIFFFFIDFIEKEPWNVIVAFLVSVTIFIIIVALVWNIKENKKRI